MQSALIQQPKLRLSLIALACHVACVGGIVSEIDRKESQSSNFRSSLPLGQGVCKLSSA